MNETEYIKEALLNKCIQNFIEAVLKNKALGLAEDTQNVSDWGTAVLAALAIRDKVEFINNDSVIK
jgi:hypothetical protein